MSGSVDFCREHAANPGCNKLDIVASKVRVRLVTDRDKAPPPDQAGAGSSPRPIRAERVLLVLADETGLSGETDDQGYVEFVNLPLAPGTLVCVVLPDILESWHTRSADTFYLEKTEHAEPTSTAGKSDAMIKTFAESHKDQLERLVKGEANWNRTEAWDKDYRQRDRTKYFVPTRKNDTSEDKTPETIRVNLLSEDDKFLHFREFIEKNKASYQPGSPRDYDDEQHRWTWGKGAVCNQFANFFLGYWFNHNAAFTTGASRTDFLSIMERVGSTRQKRSLGGGESVTMRGFNDMVHAALAPDATMESRTGAGYTYIRMNAAMWDEATHAFVKADHPPAGTKVCIYSIWDGKDPKDAKKPDPKKVDHHGGLIYSNVPGWKKMAADGYKKSDGTYTKGLIELKDPDSFKTANSTNLHLRIWPLKSLRAGGYAPGGDTGAYVAEAELAKRDTIAPDFQHALSRFLKWS